MQCEVDQECDFTRRSFLFDIEVHPRKLPLRRGNTSFAKPNVLYVLLVVDVEASKHPFDSLQCARWRFIVSFQHVMQIFCYILIDHNLFVCHVMILLIFNWFKFAREFAYIMASNNHESIHNIIYSILHWFSLKYVKWMSFS